MEDMFNVRESFNEKAYPRTDKETFVMNLTILNYVDFLPKEIQLPS
jgi:hypothetical protein